MISSTIMICPSRLQLPRQRRYMPEVTFALLEQLGHFPIRQGHIVVTSSAPAFGRPDICPTVLRRAMETPRIKKVDLGNVNNAIRHCEEPLRRSNPVAACCGPWIA